VRDESEELVEKLLLLSAVSSSSEMESSETEHPNQEVGNDNEDSVELLEAIVKHSATSSVLPLLVDCRRYSKQVGRQVGGSDER
jgi:hypothetical protein